MKYVIDIPDDIDRQLKRMAAESGQDVADLILIAIRRFLDEDVSPTSSGDESPVSERARSAGRDGCE